MKNLPVKSQQSPKPANEKPKEVLKESKSVLEEDEAEASGKFIGYWMIPHEGSYLKLGIQDSYEVNTEKFFIFTAKRKLQVDRGGSFTPIWPVIVNYESLGRHFSWLIRLVEAANPALYDPEDPEHQEEVSRIQYVLMRHGWFFFIAQGAYGYLSGMGVYPSFFDDWVKEAVGGEIRPPAHVTVNYDAIKKIVLTDERGREQQVFSMEHLGRRANNEDQPDKIPDYKQDFAGYINAIEMDHTTDPVDVGLFLTTPDYREWKGIHSDILNRVFSANEINNAAKSVHPSTLGHLRKAVHEYFKWAIANNVNIDPDDYNIPESKTESVMLSLLHENKVWERSKKYGKKKLDEVTFRRLIQYTQRYGNYKIGGLVRIANTWIYDPSVKGRIENARFIITRSPRVSIADNGSVTFAYKFKSRQNRSTTGLNHTGYIEILPLKTGVIRKVLNFFTRKDSSQWDMDVHVFCTCPDFKYRWHKALADMGASHQPTGMGGQATNEDPHIMNPDKNPCLCKHLVAMGAFIQKRPNEYAKEIKQAETEFEEKGLEPVPEGSEEPADVSADVEDLEGVEEVN